MNYIQKKLDKKKNHYTKVVPPNTITIAEKKLTVKIN